MGEMVFHCFFNLHFFLLVRLEKKNLLHIFADNSVIFFKVSFCVLCLTCWVLSVLGVGFFVLLCVTCLHNKDIKTLSYLLQVCS